ncbi:ANTAR domain-containing protein [Streptomyces sp. SYP-A7185]|uniref:ANTAR domain-containing protein n=1 Tax=Streptomyces sp. SYP-A7185 TaxID=3040076 RepID=UPI0038F63428
MSREMTREVTGAASRERLLAEAFVELADSLTDDFDVTEFLRSLAVRCVELLGVSAAGVLLADSEGELQLVAASGRHAWVRDLFSQQRDQGPCLDCHRSGTAYANVALGGLEANTAWPRFTTRARAAGYEMTQVLPLRQGDQALGTLNLFQAKPRVMGPDEIALAQALADVATIAILQRRSLEQSQVERGQLQHALTSRIAIEQAKGTLAERWHCTVDEAFGALRRHARAHRLRLTECAQQVVTGELDTESIQRG